VRFPQIIPKGFEGIVGSLVIGVTDKQDNEKSQVNPTEGIHNLLSFQGVGNEKSRSPRERAYKNWDQTGTSLFKKTVKHKTSIGQFRDIVKILGNTLLLLLSHRSPIS